MLKLSIDKNRCTACRLCTGTCVAGIIEMQDNLPVIPAEKEENCYKCLHCLTVCPTGAISILGLDPADSRQLKGNLPTPDQMETLIKGRRSIRHYLPENLDPQIINRLLETAWHAPTGKNCRQVLFTVVDDIQTMDKIRKALYRVIREKALAGTLPDKMAFFAEFAEMWEEKGDDIIFRGAPHLLIASAPANCATPTQDCMIALSYFELFAQSMGVGTAWDGFACGAISGLMPELWGRLQIPADHLTVYTIAFGKPAVSYARTAQHKPALIHKIMY